MRRAGTGAWIALLVVGLVAALKGGFSPPAAIPDGDNAATQQAPHPQDETQLTTSGEVVRILPDDRDGSRHQRFIIRVDGGTTLLIAHNIDLAPRLDGLAVGERVRVSGEFVWNPQGGTLHWTHHDPQGRHVPGYIEWRGRRYQ